jgi:hypothetical protein
MRIEPEKCLFSALWKAIRGELCALCPLKWVNAKTTETQISPDSRLAFNDLNGMRWFK